MSTCGFSVPYRVFARKQCIPCFALRHKRYLTQTLCYAIRDSFCLGTLLGCHLAASARMLVGLSLNRSHHGQRCWTDLGVIMDNCLFAIADDSVEKYSSPTRTSSKCRNLELMSSILSYKPPTQSFLVSGGGRRDEPLRHLRGRLISCYISKGLFLQHSVQQTTLTHHDQHSNQH